jgi:hypothetical protein
MDLSLLIENIYTSRIITSEKVIEELMYSLRATLGMRRRPMSYRKKYFKVRLR